MSPAEVEEGSPFLRLDPLTGRRHIFAPERRRRQNAWSGSEPRTSESCPFCPGNEHETPPELLRVGGEPWSIRVIPNRYPAVRSDGSGEVITDLLCRQEAAVGAHEVIIESSKHGDRIEDLAQEAMELVIETYIRRLRSHASNSAIAHVSLFKNSGRLAGASIDHPHSQLIALRIDPRAPGVMSGSHGQCVMCETISSEEETGSRRVVTSTRHFVVLCPCASRFPYQQQIIPRKHLPSLAAVDAEEIRDLARLMQISVRSLASLLSAPAYNWYFHNGATASDVRAHWYWELFPRVTFPGGFELGTGSWINLVAPEEAAANLAPLFRSPGFEEGSRT